jgi:hypothetical protein
MPAVRRSRPPQLLHLLSTTNFFPLPQTLRQPGEKKPKKLSLSLFSQLTELNPSDAFFIFLCLNIDFLYFMCPSVSPSI